MTDLRTEEYLRELRYQERIKRKKQQQNKPCDCPECRSKRMAEVGLGIIDKVVEPNRSNFIAELSPDYNPKTGMLESDNHRPVRMFDVDSSNTGHIAKKWIIKD